MAKEVKYLPGKAYVPKDAPYLWHSVFISDEKGILMDEKGNTPPNDKSYRKLDDQEVEGLASYCSKESERLSNMRKFLKVHLAKITF